MADIERPIHGRDSHIEAMPANLTLDLALRVFDRLRPDFELHTVVAGGDMEMCLPAVVFHSQQQQHLALVTNRSSIEDGGALHRHLVGSDDRIAAETKQRRRVVLPHNLGHTRMTNALGIC